MLTDDQIVLLSLASPQVVTLSWSSEDPNLVAASKLESMGYLRHLDGYGDPDGAETNIWEITEAGWNEFRTDGQYVEEKK